MRLSGVNCSASFNSCFGDIDMTQLTSLALFKTVLLSGLALWLVVIVVNNVIAFRNGVRSIGALMGMQLFDQNPAIDSPLLSRRVKSASWHQAVYVFILLIEVAVAVLLIRAAFAYIGVLAGGTDIDAVQWANLALSAFVAMAMVMLLGGAWFAYYIRQEGTQITHFVLIGIGVASAVLMNMPGS